MKYLKIDFFFLEEQSTDYDDIFKEMRRFKVILLTLYWQKESEVRQKSSKILLETVILNLLCGQP